MISCIYIIVYVFVSSTFKEFLALGSIRSSSCRLRKKCITPVALSIRHGYQSNVQSFLNHTMTLVGTVIVFAIVCKMAIRRPTEKCNQPIAALAADDVIYSNCMILHDADIRNEICEGMQSFRARTNKKIELNLCMNMIQFNAIVQLKYITHL